jgi:hypothetical protein
MPGQAHRLAGTAFSSGGATPVSVSSGGATPRTCYVPGPARWKSKYIGQAVVFRGATPVPPRGHLPGPPPGGRPPGDDSYFLFLRWIRVFFSSLRCFFFAIRLRRFLMTEPIRPPSLRHNGTRARHHSPADGRLGHTPEISEKRERLPLTQSSIVPATARRSPRGGEPRNPPRGPELLDGSGLAVFPGGDDLPWTRWQT